MTSTSTTPVRKARTYGRALEVVGLAILAYVPFLLSRPGMLSADTKQYLYLDPGRLLSRAPYLWDPHVAAGTVPHQQVGYLFPMGPYYWVMDAVGVPDWVAQRLWLGTISLAAALGARWLFTVLGVRRAGALAGALVYMLCPYQLAFTARISVLLLPWAGLPWLIGLTIRATRRGGWRHPALFALVTLTIGGVNASALLLVGVGPALWLLFELGRGREAARSALAAVLRIGVLTVSVSIWWIVGLRIQGAYGLPVLQLTENLRTITEGSLPEDLLRGLGNWFFYGGDRLGFAIDQAEDYALDDVVIFFSYAVPVLGFAAAVLVRWRHRAYFALLVILGTVVGVGAWPFDDPSPYGEVWKRFANESSLGLALRNTPRVVPVVALGIAGLLAAAVSAVRWRRAHGVAFVTVAGLAGAALWPVWSLGYLSKGVERPEEIPAYWTEAAAAMDEGGDATRVLELPGSNFAAYRWGNAIEPVTPGLIDRPYLAREVLPYGSPQSVNLLDALDRRLQQGTLEPASLAPIARLFGVGTIALRSDLQYERYRTPRPRLLWAGLTDPLAPGLERPKGFGDPVRNTPVPQLPMLDELELRTPTEAPDPPPVSLFDVEDPVPIVHTAPAGQPVVLGGDGDGIVDAAAAGLLDGRALVRLLASMDDEELDQTLDAGADLVLTDSNRRRSQNWFSSVRDTKGATERAGRDAPDPIGYDFRLDLFPDAPEADVDAARTVVEHLGGSVEATGDGGPGRPEDRPVGAYDGDVRTSWRVGGPNPAGQRLVLQTEGPVRTDRLTLVQPQDGPRDRVLTQVRLRFDEGEPLTVDLGPQSQTPEGQVVRFPMRSTERIEIELAATSVPPIDPARANAVGFAEVRFGDVQVTETVRLPVDLAHRIGHAAADHRLDIVMSRLRYEPSERDRQDEELVLDRRFELPDGRSFLLGGAARVNPNAKDATLDEVLGTVAEGTTYTASSHLGGDLEARASRAFDDDGGGATAWTTAIGPQEGQWLDVALPRRVTVDRVALTVAVDGRHSVPTRLSLVADGGAVQTLDVPEVADSADVGATASVTIPFEAVRAGQLRLVVDEVRRKTAVPGDADPARALPVAIVDAELAGVPAPAAPRDLSTPCRDDLLRVDGAAVGVRIAGPVADARRGLALETCEGSIELGEGSHRLRAEPGLDTAIDLDRLVLGSDAEGEATPIGTRGAPLDRSGATVSVTASGPTAFDVTARTDGEPFWLVLGQSHSEGWEAAVGSGSLGPRQVVDGYANGWLVTPSGPGTMSIDLRWGPQRLVWIGLALSSLATLACLGVVVATSRRGRRAVDGDALAEEPGLASPLRFPAGPAPGWVATVALAAAVGLVAAAASRFTIGLIAGGATLVANVVPISRPVLVVAVPLTLAVSRIEHRPELAWLALALLGVDLAVGWLRARNRRPTRPPTSRWWPSRRAREETWPAATSAAPAE